MFKYVLMKLQKIGSAKCILIKVSKIFMGKHDLYSSKQKLMCEMLPFKSCTLFFIHLAH